MINLETGSTTQMGRDNLDGSS